jgi:hypothetical protein
MSIIITLNLPKNPWYWVPSNSMPAANEGAMIKSPLTFTSLSHTLSKEQLSVYWRTIWQGVLYFLESLGVSTTRRESTVPGIPWKIIHIGWWPSCTLFVSVLQLSIKLQKIVYRAAKQSVENFCLVLSLVCE